LSIFDTPIDRRDSDSIKWSKYAGRDILPLWVADMDFAAPPAVIAALQQRIAHGVFGYGGPGRRSRSQCSLTLKRSTAGLSSRNGSSGCRAGHGLNVACRAVDGDVLTATPIYPPFLSAPHFSGRKLNRCRAGKAMALALGQNCPQIGVDRSNPAFPALPPAQPGWPLLEPR
jgi:cystathionine beta-lyase